MNGVYAHAASRRWAIWSFLSDFFSEVLAEIGAVASLAARRDRDRKIEGSNLVPNTPTVLLLGGFFVPRTMAGPYGPPYPQSGRILPRSHNFCAALVKFIEDSSPIHSCAISCKKKACSESSIGKGGLLADIADGR
jgi:hypothetical protein